MKSHARVVVIGGGIVGCSLLYRLTRLGWRDVVLLEKTELTAGTTWHSAGHLILVDESPAIARLNVLSCRMYEELEADTGLSVGRHKVGSLRLARSRSRFDRYKALGAKMRFHGIAYEMLGPDEAKKHFPLMETDGLEGASWAPDEAFIDPSMATQAFAQGARAAGAEINRQTKVTGLSRRPSGEWLVQTSKGDIVAEHVVNAAGIWAPTVAGLVGKTLPIIPTERQYLVTEPVPEIKALGFELPILRDYDVPFYFRQERDSLIMGVHEPHTPYCFVDGIPEDFGQELLPPDLERGAACIEEGMRRVPTLGKVGIKRVICGPTSRTTDFNGLLGPLAGAPNFWVLAGFSAGISHGGGVGQLLAEWIVEGEPSLDVSPLDVNRFGPYANKTYIKAMLGEAHTYGSLDPNAERMAGRPARTSPLYHQQKAAGASFAVRLGWECPSWYRTSANPERDKAVAAECRAVRERVGLLDLSSLAKYDLKGPGAASFVAEQLGGTLRSDGAIERVTLTTPKGRIEAAFTILRVSDKHYYLTAVPEAELHHQACLERRLPLDGSVQIDNVTGRYGALMLAGPLAREVLGKVTEAKIAKADFPAGTGRMLDMGYATARVMRVSDVGELAFELHIEMEYLNAVHGALKTAGAEAGIADIGFRAYDALRLEKANPQWGSELTFEVAAARNGNGKAHKAGNGGNAPSATWLSMKLGGGESANGAVLYHGDRPIALVRTSSPGHSVGTGIAFAHVPAELAREGTVLECLIKGERRTATVIAGALYDPKEERTRA
ncbi:MAG: FAD-dependent oxidoreductase [Alphaproteobacteria bacterium]|nr:FAD-dependent oxidoreductase [Alphaproteobacteria bacterium]